MAPYRPAQQVPEHEQNNSPGLQGWRRGNQSPSLPYTFPHNYFLMYCVYFVLFISHLTMLPHPPKKYVQQLLSAIIQF